MQELASKVLVHTKASVEDPGATLQIRLIFETCSTPLLLAVAFEDRRIAIRELLPWHFMCYGEGVRCVHTQNIWSCPCFQAILQFLVCLALFAHALALFAYYHHKPPTIPSEQL